MKNSDNQDRSTVVPAKAISHEKPLADTIDRLLEIIWERKRRYDAAHPGWEHSQRETP